MRLKNREQFVVSRNLLAQEHATISMRINLHGQWREMAHLTEIAFDLNAGETDFNENL